LNLFGHKIFYGWVLVAVAFVAGAFSTGPVIWGVSVFVTPMSDELGWSRTSFFFAMTIRSIIAGVTAPFIGPLQDTKQGPRILMLGSAILLALSLMGLKYVHHLWELYLLIGVVGGITQMGAGAMLTQAVLPKWFIRRRGRAMGIALMGSGFGPMLFPITIQGVLALVGWRDAWMLMGIFTLIVLAPLSLLVRTQPADIGLLPDGDTEPRDVSAGGVRPPQEVSLTRKEAFRTSAFWFIAAGIMLASVGLQGFQANLLPHFQNIGYSAAIGSLAITLYGACSVSVRILWGALGERFQIRYLLVVQTFLTGCSIIWLLVMPDNNKLLLFGFAAFHGMSIGGYFILQPMLVADYFGRNHLGGIQGVLRPFTTAATAVSPIIVAVAYDSQGSYFWGFFGVMMAYFMASTVIGMAKHPRRGRTLVDVADAQQG
jgi:MFS family permease